MPSVSLTLVADGASDRVLLPFIAALMDSHCPDPYVAQFADGLPAGARTIGDRMKAAISLYPCDMLFVHRDAESEDATTREAEIRRGMEGFASPPSLICVVPVRMTEAWLLASETAIRAAVGNPNGTAPLNLPPLARIESVDAKEALFRALEAAKDVSARRRSRFRPESYRHRVAELFQDMASVRRLTSFQHLESQVSAFFSTYS
jgi:hypothetical protein